MSYALSTVGLVFTLGASISSVFIKGPIEPFWNLILTFQLIALSPMF